MIANSFSPGALVSLGDAQILGLHQGRGALLEEEQPVEFLAIWRSAGYLRSLKCMPGSPHSIGISHSLPKLRKQILSREEVYLKPMASLLLKTFVKY